MGKTMKAYRRPGRIQTGLVFLVCLLLMVVSVCVGAMLLLGEPIGFDLHWVEEELQGYFH